MPAKANWLKLNPKIRTALLAAIAVAVVTVGNAFVDVYPETAFAQIIQLLIPVLAGYLQPAAPKP